MKEKNLKQIDVARGCGLSQAGVNKWCRGNNIPKSMELLALSRLLKVSMEYLLCGDDAMPAQEFHEQHMEELRAILKRLEEQAAQIEELRVRVKAKLPPLNDSGVATAPQTPGS